MWYQQARSTVAIPLIPLAGTLSLLPDAALACRPDLTQEGDEANIAARYERFVAVSVGVMRSALGKTPPVVCSLSE